MLYFGTVSLKENKCQISTQMFTFIRFQIIYKYSLNHFLFYLYFPFINIRFVNSRNFHIFVYITNLILCCSKHMNRDSYHCIDRVWLEELLKYFSAAKMRKIRKRENLSLNRRFTVTFCYD